MLEKNFYDRGAKKNLVNCNECVILSLQKKS